MSYNEAILEINELLATIPETSGVQGKFNAMLNYQKMHHGEADKLRAVATMIKYYEREARANRFSSFVDKKARVINKKVKNLSSEDYKRFQEDFNRLEEQARRK